MPEGVTKPILGLEGVVMTDTTISKVDGEIGRLQYCGYDILDFAEEALFEEIIFLLWNRRLPNEQELHDFRQALTRHRTLRKGLIRVMQQYPNDGHPMSVLRTSVSGMGLYDLDAENNNPRAIYDKSEELVDALPIIIASWERIRTGKDPIEPRSDLTIAENFLYMLTGEMPQETQISALNSYLVLLAEQGLNASTFSARVTASTSSDLYSAVTTAIGTLKGPAHGGANQAAMEQFLEIGSLDNVKPWFEDAVLSGKRLMGIGHRVYKVEDPRAKILRRQADELTAGTEGRKWFEIAVLLEQLSRQHEFFIQRNLFVNVDYYSAIVLYQLGIPVDQFVSLFAMSRIAGWCANIMEQVSNNRLIRPRGNYVGLENQKWIPIQYRK